MRRFFPQPARPRLLPASKNLHISGHSDGPIAYGQQHHTRMKFSVLPCGYLVGGDNGRSGGLGYPHGINPGSVVRHHRECGACWRPAWAVVGVVWQHSNRCLDREAGSAGTAGAASFTYAGKNSDRGAVSVAPIASASVRRDTDDLPSGAVRPGCAASTRLSAYSKGACRLRAKEPHTLLMNLVHLLLCRVIYGHALQI